MHNTVKSQILRTEKWIHIYESKMQLWIFLYMKNQIMFDVYVLKGRVSNHAVFMNDVVNVWKSRLVKRKR